MCHVEEFHFGMAQRNKSVAYKCGSSTTNMTGVLDWKPVWDPILVSNSIACVVTFRLAEESKALMHHHIIINWLLNFVLMISKTFPLIFSMKRHL